MLDAKLVISCKLGWIYLTNKTPVVDPVYCTPVNAEEETGGMWGDVRGEPNTFKENSTGTLITYGLGIV